MARNIYTQILKEICVNENIEYQSFSDDWFFCLTKNGETRYIYDHQFSLNDAVARALSHDKCATGDVLAHDNIPHVKHVLIADGETNDAQLNQLLETHKRLVIKKNTGTGGRDIFLVQSPREMNEAVSYLLPRYGFAAVSPYHEITAEYRVVILDNTAELVYEKIRPENEWRHNLQHGAMPRILPCPPESADEPPAQRVNPGAASIISLAFKAVKALRLRFASVDVISCNEELLVLEVNAGVMMEYFAACGEDCYRQAKRIYAGAVRKMFSNWTGC